MKELIQRLMDSVGKSTTPQERHLKIKELGRALRLEEAPILKELELVGIAIDSVWDLVNTSVPYPNAIPILLDHLRRPYSGRTREGIARALAVPDARPAWGLLTALYRQERDDDAKSGLAVAIAATTTKDVLDQLIDLIREREHGSSRLLLLRALKRSKDPKALKTLIELQTDPDLQKEIQIILRKKKLPRHE